MKNNKVETWKSQLAAPTVEADNPAGFIELDEWEALGVSGGGFTNTCGCCTGTCGQCCGSSGTCTCSCG
jgi:hypothetical protein